jgi:hypothetical protein
VTDEKTINKAIDHAWIDIRSSSNFDKEEAITKLIEARLLARLASRPPSRDVAERLAKAAEQMHASLTEIAGWVEEHPLERDRDGGQALDRLLLLKAWGEAIASFRSTSAEVSDG